MCQVNVKDVEEKNINCFLILALSPPTILFMFPLTYLICLKDAIRGVLR